MGASWIGEQLARLMFAFALVGPAGVSGTFFGTPLALVAVVVVLVIPLRRILPHRTPAGEHPLRHLLTTSARVNVAPIRLAPN